MRRLADLAFMFRLYELAYQIYHAAKKDFNNEHAWLHFAGAMVRQCFRVNFHVFLELVPENSHFMTYGHMLWKDDNVWMKKRMDFEVVSVNPSGRPKRTWEEVFEAEMRNLKMKREDPMVTGHYLR